PWLSRTICGEGPFSRPCCSAWRRASASGPAPTSCGCSQRPRSPRSSPSAGAPFRQSGRHSRWPREPSSELFLSSSTSLAPPCGLLHFEEATRHPRAGPVLLQRLHNLADLMIPDAEQRQIWAGPPLRRWELGVGIALLLLVLAAAIVPARDAIAGKWRRAFA